MAEKCIPSIVDESSLSYLVAFESLDNENDIISNTDHHHISYTDNTPIISLNNSASDLNIITATTNTNVVVLVPDIKTCSRDIIKSVVLSSINDEIIHRDSVVDDIDDEDFDDGRIKECLQQSQENINGGGGGGIGEKVEIFLETPVIDDQKNIVLSSVPATLVKPKRLSDEFFSADDGDEDEVDEDDDACSECSDEKIMLQQNHKGVLVLCRSTTTTTTMTTATIVNNKSECGGSRTSSNSTITEGLISPSLEIEDDELSSSNFLKKIDINEIQQQHPSSPLPPSPQPPPPSVKILIEPNISNVECSPRSNNNTESDVAINKASDNNNGMMDVDGGGGSSGLVLGNVEQEEEIIYDENDVQSMDAIERRDYEQEQKLTGGVIVRNSSLINNDNRLNIGLGNKNINKCCGVGSNENESSSQSNSLITTPTSSRSLTAIRTTKSAVKLNLSATLDRVSGSSSTSNNDKSESDNNIDIVSLDVISKSLSRKVKSNSSGTSSSIIVERNADDDDDDEIMHTSSSVPTTSTASSSSSSTATLCSSPTTSRISSSKTRFRPSNIIRSILNSNSNDSLSSEEGQSSGGCGGVSASSTNTTSEDLPLSSVPAIESKLCGAFSGMPSSSSSSTSSSSSPNFRYSGNCCNENTDDNDVEIVNNEEENEPSSRLKPKSQIKFEASDFPSSSSNATTTTRRTPKLPSTIERIMEDQMLQPAQVILSVEQHHEFEEDTWADCEEGSDIEEVCTCKNYTDEDAERHNGESEDELPSRDVDLTGYSNLETSLSEDFLDGTTLSDTTTPRIHRKRKLTGTLGNDLTPGGRKRLALQQSSLSPRLSTSSTTPSLLASSPLFTSPTLSSGRRTPRSLIPSKDNPPPELLDSWLVQFQKWSQCERILAIDRLIDRCEPTQVRHMMKVIEPQFQRDFISLLPKELALQVLSYLDPDDLLRAAQTCRSWRFLCDDNLLWKEKCKQASILMETSTDRPKRGRAGNMPPISSPWKAAYMRQHIIEMNWRSRPIRDPKILKGHDDHVITCLQFCGNRIVSGSDDNTLKVWSAVSGKCLRTLVGHTGGVWSSQMSGNIIISGSTDRTLKVWNADSGHCTHTLYGHTSTVRCMHLHENKVVSGSRDATLRVWDVTTGTCLHVLVGHLAAVRCVQYDGRLVVSGAYDYMVKVWNPERQECLHTLQGHTNRVYSLQFDGIHVVSGSLDTSIRVWDAETGSLKHTLMGHQSLTSGMELRQNILVSGNADSTVKVWDILTGHCLQTLSGSNKHQSAVTCLQFNSRFVVTSSDDGTVKLWDVKTGDFIRNLVALDSGGSGGVVWRIRANDTKLVCAVGSRNGTEETKLMVLDFDVEGACLKCS